MFFGDFVNGATHVDVDQFGAMIDRPDRGLWKWIGPIAVQLHAAGLIELIGLRKFKRATRSAQKRVAI